ncbi:D-glycero-beta-D-manno-heptose 1-phosphate adenylyltransferase [Kitasatospora sp. NPDC001539]|uniref:D-glycero-beta-D-manno-heptose 1-phosphate adenylyltransferase n=1 Tax=Kitasatospora sp. NPDC001539 TaxID=3154384 RepID=UPI00333368EB
MNGPLVVVGDALLDRDIDGDAGRLTPDAPAPVVDVTAEHARPGGAGLAARLADRAGADVLLVTALGESAAAETVRAALAPEIGLAELPLDGELPVKTRVRAGGRPLVRFDRGGGTPGTAGPHVRRAIREAGAVLVADYGNGTARALRPLLAEAARRVPVVWDPHPRGGPPVRGVRLATPNGAEARRVIHRADPPGPAGALAGDLLRASLLARRWQAAAVAVTLGARGAVLSRGTENPLVLPSPFTAHGDPCGAGDCFAAVAAAALAAGALPEEAAGRAVLAAADFVARGGASDPALWSDAPAPEPGPHRDARALAEAVRARGGTVVATGGCFDLLHTGHVSLLEAARRLGDCLIVCLNSDASVRRLKGRGRPINPAADRARVLAGLSCVDAVVVFDEDGPQELLAGLRPHVWVKGGDYTVGTLPEAAVLRDWGGQAVVLPYVAGHSTTALAGRAARAAAVVADGAVGAEP